MAWRGPSKQPRSRDARSALLGDLASWRSDQRRGHNPSPTAEWTSEDAKHVLWDLIRQTESHGVYRVNLEPSAAPVDWVMEIETDTGHLITQPLRLSNAAIVWLEERRLSIPGSRSLH